MLKRRLTFVLIAGTLAACAEQPHRIGVWSGPTGANLAKMVESEINFNGGVVGRRLKVRVVDQRSVVMNELTPAILRASLDSIASDTSVAAVVTRMTDSITEQGAQLFERNRIPYLITTPVDDKYLETHPHAFLLVPTVQQQAEFLASQAEQEPAPRRVAILNVREGHAEALAAEIGNALARRGIKPVFTTSFSQSTDELNLTAKARELASYDPTILYFVGRSPSLLVVHPVIRNAIPAIRILASDLAESWHVYMNPQGIYTGVRLVRYMDPTSQDSLIRGLRDRLLVWIGRNELTNEATLTYDALRGLAEIMRTGATSRVAVLEYLRNNPTVNGLGGAMEFTAQRVPREMHLAEVRRNSVVRVSGRQEQHTLRE